MMKKIIKNKISISIKISILVMLISFLGIATLSYISYNQAKNIFIDHTAQILDNDLNEYSNDIKNSLNKLKYNITILSYNPSVKGFMRAYLSKYKYDEVTNKTYNQYKNDITTIISLMMKQNPEYFQVRILNAQGKELIKLIRNNHNKIIKPPQNLLQDKSNASYFKNSIKLKTNKIYLSNINLNREFHTIEFPLKPTIRIANIIYIKNRLAGVTIINANIKKLFKFEKLRESKEIKTYIANMNGYYIFDEDDPNKEFGFEFGRDFKITDRFPFLKKLYDSDKKQLSLVDYKNNKIIEAKKVYITKNRYLVVLKITTTAMFEKKSKEYKENLLIAILLITLFITLITTFLVSTLTKPITELTKIATKIAKTKGKEKVEININSNDEVGELARAFDIMLKSLIESKREIEQFANKLEIEVEKKTKELQEINANLQKMVEKQVNEIRKKDSALSQQSKMAAMGEMIGAIAHQWRQPLNALAINIQLLEDMYEDGSLDEKTLKEFIEKNMETIQFMSNTIDDFRNFFRKDKVKTDFDVKEVIEKTLNLQKAQLKDHNIEVETNLESAKINGYKNEFMQTILNIISNAKDAIDEKREKDKDFKGKIKITSKKIDNSVIIEIEDNGGGIPKEIKDRLFEPYFTTKEEGKGTGMGLYMVKEIIERMNGKIEATNTKEGAKFIITLKAENEK